MLNDVNNILIRYGNGGLGDLLVVTPFFKDFCLQYPSKKLYFQFKHTIVNRYAQVFQNNPYFNLYTGSERIDKVMEFDWADANNEIEKRRLFDKTAKYIDNFYYEFSKKTGLHVTRTLSAVDVYLSDEEKAEVENFIQQKKKPMCIVNIGYHPLYTTCRNWGWENFQYVVNSLCNKIDFMQFGDTTHGFFHRALANCTNMLDKTDIRAIIKLTLASNFVLSNDSSPYHFASIDSPYANRVVVTILGGKAPYEWLNCYKPKNVKYELLYNNDKFQQCYDVGKYCCDFGNTYVTPYNFAPIMKHDLCKKPVVNSAGQIVASCFNAITPNEVVACFEKYLQEPKHLNA